MELPDLSNSMYVAGLRYIQSIHEPAERRNPDTLVRHFIPMLQRWRTAWLGRERLARLRADPFYDYLIARTKYYDTVVNEAVADGVRQIVGIGCGSDTRAYRFNDLLLSQDVKVLECDQREAIQAKQRMAKRWRALDYVQYLPIDLNDAGWPALECRLRACREHKTLVVMEGVSPYVDDAAFGLFLCFLATTLPAGSGIAYDFKVRGVKDDFGRAGRTRTPFRLSAVRDEVAAFHLALGLRLERMESSADLCARLLTRPTDSEAPRFGEDCLVQLRVSEG